MSFEEQISVIIPNLNSPIVDKTIESVLSQKTDYSVEVIVVGMDKFGLVEKFENVIFKETPKPIGAAEARNIGIREAQGNWLLFIDSDCIANQGWINSFVESFLDGWKVIGGGVRSPEEPFWRLVYNLSMFHEQLVSKKRKQRSFLPTLNLAVQRTVIENVGYLDESLIRGQDVDWTARMGLAGYRLLFDPAAAIVHYPERNDLETLKRYFFRSGQFMIKVRYKYPKIFHMPAIFKHALMWRVFGPVIAAWTSLKILFRTKEVQQHLKTLPYIYLLKLSWCYGAAESLQRDLDETA